MKNADSFLTLKRDICLWGGGDPSLGFGGFCVPCDLSSSTCLKSTSSSKTPCLSFSSIRINYVGDTTSKFP